MGFTDVYHQLCYGVTQMSTKPLISQEAHTRAQQQHLRELEAAEELAKKNFNFLQVEKRSIKEIRRLAKQSPAAHEILLLMAEKMNRENALMVSLTTLMELTGRSRPTVARALKVLKDELWVQVVKVGTANAYLINNSVFWQSAGDKKHAHFRASIIASSADQDEDVDVMSKTKLKHFPFLDIRETAQNGGQVLISNDDLPPPDQAEMDV